MLVELVGNTVIGHNMQVGQVGNKVIGHNMLVEHRFISAM